jgi:hypothetical protein
MCFSCVFLLISALFSNLFFFLLFLQGRQTGWRVYPIKFGLKNGLRDKGKYFLARGIIFPYTLISYNRNQYSFTCCFLSDWQAGSAPLCAGREKLKIASWISE